MTEFYLTDSDKELLQQMIRRELQGLVNPGSDPGSNFNPRGGSETFLAKLKSGVSIPGIDMVVDPPIIAAGDCEIYYIDSDSAEIKPFQFRGETLIRSVRNATTAAMEDEDLFFLITRDKFGNFFNLAGGACEGRNERWALYMQGPPTGGTFKFNLKVNGVIETITFDFDADATEIKTAMEGHSEVEVDEVLVTGGPLPSVSVQFEWVEGLEKKLIPVPDVDTALLTGSGLGITLVRIERGFPGDATNAPPP